MLVQIAEDGNANDDHDYAEGDEAVARGEERPIVGRVAFEEGDLGEYEEYCSQSSAAGFSTLGLHDGGEGEDSLLTQPVTKWVTPSKKKNLETMKVLTSMTKLAATTERRAITFNTRMTLRTT